MMADRRLVLRHHSVFLAVRTQLRACLKAAGFWRQDLVAEISGVVLVPVIAGRQQFQEGREQPVARGAALLVSVAVLGNCGSGDGRQVRGGTGSSQGSSAGSRDAGVATA